MPYASTKERGGFTDVGGQLKGGPIERADDDVDIGDGVIIHGFGFFIGGTMLAGELLGGCVFPFSMTFANADSNTVTSLVPATANATFNIVTGFPDTVIGTIFFAAGSSIGVVSWSGGTQTLPSGTQLRLVAPNPADVTLSYVSGTIQGTRVS